MPVTAKKINRTILISPLDWGLGHATRCIPVIELLIHKRCRVIIACNFTQEILLRAEFPDLEYLRLEGYNITYRKKNIMLGLMLQLPRFFHSIKRENKWLSEIINQYQPDAIISDNRYGFYHGKVPCILITHQLQLQMPPGFDRFQSFFSKTLYRYVNRFTECWVPDMESATDSLAGALSHPRILPEIPVTYIGWLSRFKKTTAIPKKYWLTICLSGPEPQRSLLEKILLPQLALVDFQVLLIRGLPGETAMLPVPKHVEAVNHLPARQMALAFQQTEFVISRSGYSTLMDMQVLGCKCIFIPTPGQTEQEYLAKQLIRKKMAVVRSQGNFNLLSALREASDFDYQSSGFRNNDLLEKVITGWLARLENR